MLFTVQQVPYFNDDDDDDDDDDDGAVDVVLPQISDNDR